MAGRKDKNTVDYFPHECEPSGKTLFILESKFDHGYKIWYKTLERLGKSENHYIDLRNDTDLLFLISKLQTTEQELIEIYNLLASLGAIDSFFWSKKIVFSENFIKNISDAYKRRNNKCKDKCQLCMHLFNICDQSDNICKQISTKESKGKESKGKNTPSANGEDFYLTKKKKKLSGKRLEKFLIFWDKFGYKDGKAEAADSWLEIDTLSDSICEVIFSAAEEEAKRRPLLIAANRTPKMAQGWLSAKRWENEGIVPPESNKSNKPIKRPLTNEELERKWL